MHPPHQTPQRHSTTARPTNARQRFEVNRPKIGDAVRHLERETLIETQHEQGACLPPRIEWTNDFHAGSARVAADHLIDMP
jgi:DNA-binding FadR family transcriptional regulator